MIDLITERLIILFANLVNFLVLIIYFQLNAVSSIKTISFLIRYLRLEMSVSCISHLPK